MDAMTHMTPDEMDAVVDGMSAEEKEYLRLIIARVMACFAKEDAHAVLLFGNSEQERLAICTVNCAEMDAAHVVAHAHDLMMFTNTHDAPPKEMFN